MFDDDGKDSSDESIGVGFFTLTELGWNFSVQNVKLISIFTFLENAYRSQSLLPIQSKRFSKKTGSILLVQFKIISEAAPGPCSSYPAPAPSKAPEQNLYPAGHPGAVSGAGGFVMPGRN